MIGVFLERCSSLVEVNHRSLSFHCLNGLVSKSVSLKSVYPKVSKYNLQLVYAHLFCTLFEEEIKLETEEHQDFF